jgi:hypothetical protein
LGILASLVALVAFLVTVSWWSLLPLAFLPLLMAVGELPRLLQPPARSLVLRGYYSSLFLGTLIIVLAALENMVQPAWLWGAENFIFDHRETLDAIPILKPAAILPIIGMCGAISFCRGDTRPINVLGWALSVTGNVSLFVYTLSFFTLFTIEPTQYLVDKVQAREIAKYQIAFDAEKRAVGRYLASQAVQEILTKNSAGTKSPLLVLLDQVIKANSNLACGVHLANGTCIQPISALWSPTQIIQEAVRELLAAALRGVVDNKQPDFSALVSSSTAEFRTVEDYSDATERSKANTDRVMAQTEAVIATLDAAIGPLLDLGPDVNRYLKDALGEVLGAIADQYVIPGFDRIAMYARGFSDFLETGTVTDILSTIEPAISQMLSFYDSPDSVAVQFQQLVSDQTKIVSAAINDEAKRRIDDLIQRRIEENDPSRGTERGIP